MDMSEVRRFEDPHRLSRAILAGAKLRPQASYAWFDDVGSCAWGAAFEGVGFSLTDYLGDDHDPIGLLGLALGHEYLTAADKACQLCYGFGIAGLNDVIGLPRERIAALLAAIGY